ncbi:MAG: hypothetical protein P8P30_09025 [Rickettsiales bacterium]|nr:hypothetical protein [Rickettsiales bacterium]
MVAAPDPFVAQPSRSNLQVDDSSQVGYRPIAFSNKVKHFAHSVANNPSDFLFSVATSVAVFALVRMAVGGAIAMAGLSALATPIMVTMLAAGLVGLYRGNQEAKREGKKREAALYAAGGQPTSEEIANAHKVEASSVISAGIKHAIVSGIIGSIIGASLSGDWPEISEYLPQSAMEQGAVISDGGGHDAGDHKVGEHVDEPAVEEHHEASATETKTETHSAPVDGAVTYSSAGEGVTSNTDAEGGANRYVFKNVDNFRVIENTMSGAEFLELNEQIRAEQQQDFINEFNAQLNTLPDVPAGEVILGEQGAATGAQDTISSLRGSLIDDILNRTPPAADSLGRHTDSLMNKVELEGFNPGF